MKTINGFAYLPPVWNDLQAGLFDIITKLKWVYLTICTSVHLFSYANSVYIVPPLTQPDNQNKSDLILFHSEESSKFKLCQAQLVRSLSAKVSQPPRSSTLSQYDHVFCFCFCFWVLLCFWCGVGFLYVLQFDGFSSGISQLTVIHIFYLLANWVSFYCAFFVLIDMM